MKESYCSLVDVKTGSLLGEVKNFYSDMETDIRGMPENLYWRVYLDKTSLLIKPMLKVLYGWSLSYAPSRVYQPHKEPLAGRVYYLRADGEDKGIVTITTWSSHDHKLLGNIVQIKLKHIKNLEAIALLKNTPEETT